MLCSSYAVQDTFFECFHAPPLLILVISNTQQGKRLKRTDFVSKKYYLCINRLLQLMETVITRKLPIGIQTFEDIRKGNYLYVDKTALAWQIANTGKPYFLSRPRCFGKSLLLSTFESYFTGIIRRAYEQTGRGVVVLVDEYDKPLLQAINNPELLENYQQTLKAFYGVLKSSDRHLRFVFLTSVTKFSQVSVRERLFDPLHRRWLGNC